MYSSVFSLGIAINHADKDAKDVTGDMVIAAVRDRLASLIHDAGIGHDIVGDVWPPEDTSEVEGRMATEWTNKDGDRARADGWLISLAHLDGGRREYQLQRFDEDPRERFSLDDDAWAHVYARAMEGSRLHKKALAYLEEQNPSEYKAIVEFGKVRIALAEMMTGPPIPKLRED